MSWIKRNLYFLLGSLVAVVLLGLAVWYGMGKSLADGRAMAELNQAYEELQRLNSLSPHPGAGDVDNIDLGKKQQEQLRAHLVKARELFVPIPAIPDNTNVTAVEFTAQLRRTIDQMQRDAAQSGVTLPPRYGFTFEAIRPKVTFAPASLQALAVQLGEIKSICDVLFRAKITSLDNLRREKVAAEDDPMMAAADYLTESSVTNDLAVLTPYDVTFRCFSADFASVLSGLANSSHGFIVKFVNIEPGAPTTPGGFETMETPTYTPSYTPPVPTYPQPGRPMMIEEGGPPRYPPTHYAQPQAYPPTMAVAGRPGPQILINEKVFRVTMRIEVVKLLPPAK